MDRQISTISISCHKSTGLLQYIHSSNSILILSIMAYWLIDTSATKTTLQRHLKFVYHDFSICLKQYTVCFYLWSAKILLV